MTSMKCPAVLGCRAVVSHSIRFLAQPPEQVHDSGFGRVFEGALSDLGRLLQKLLGFSHLRLPAL